MKQTVITLFILLGSLALLSLVAWISRKRPDSLPFRVATWCISFIKNSSKNTFGDSGPTSGLY